MSGITIDQSLIDFAQTFGVLALLILLMIPAVVFSLVVMGRALLRQINVTADAIVRTGEAMQSLTRRVERAEVDHAARLDRLDQSIHQLAVRLDAMPLDVRRELDPVFATLHRALDRIEKKRSSPGLMTRLFGMERF